ncbi:MAG: phage head closure protein [Anaerolineales bacterium]|nr:MAG: phage head closure protein [Anaerolineales bacterium]
MTLTAAELADMRATIAELLPDTCVIKTLTTAPDGMGGQTETWSASGTATCRLDRRSGNERMAGGAIRAYGEWVLTVPYNTALTTDNRVEHNGLTYNVTEVNSDKSWKDCVRATVEMVA